MNNTVTFETAKRLRDAGFPQPTPQAGQFWYSNGELGVLVVAFGEIEVWQPLVLGAEWQRLSDETFEWVFAPTAIDILRELAKVIYPNILRVDISAFDSSMDGLQEPKVLIYSFGSSAIIGHEWYENPHEAAAIAWLAKNEKTNEIT